MQTVVVLLPVYVVAEPPVGYQQHNLQLRLSAEQADVVARLQAYLTARDSREYSAAEAIKALLDQAHLELQPQLEIYAASQAAEAERLRLEAEQAAADAPGDPPSEDASADASAFDDVPSAFDAPQKKASKKAAKK